MQLILNSNASTSELGEQTSFTVVLDSEPKAPVLFTVSSTDASEGVADTHLFALSAENWAVGKVITVTGQYDNEADGDVPYSVRVSPILSEDEDYVSLETGFVSLTNYDDPANELVISASPLACDFTEAGEEECVVSFELSGWYRAPIRSRGEADCCDRGAARGDDLGRRRRSAQAGDLRCGRLELAGRHPCHDPRNGRRSCGWRPVLRGRAVGGGGPSWAHFPRRPSSQHACFDLMRDRR